MHASIALFFSVESNDMANMLLLSGFPAMVDCNPDLGDKINPCSLKLF